MSEVKIQNLNIINTPGAVNPSVSQSPVLLDPRQLQMQAAIIQAAALAAKPCNGTTSANCQKPMDPRQFGLVQFAPPTATPPLSPREREVIAEKKQAYRKGVNGRPPKNNKKLLDVIQRTSVRPDLNESPRILRDKQIVAANELFERSRVGGVQPALLNLAKSNLSAKAQNDPSFVTRYDAINGPGSFERDVLGNTTVSPGNPPRTFA